MTIDPKDLSKFYFGSGNEKSSEGEEYKRGKHDEFYVNPSIAIQTATTVNTSTSTSTSTSNGSNMIVHGRGMVATKDIAAGECIFITPPTVGLDMDSIKSKFKESTNTMTLEDLAMEELIDNMTKDIESRRDGENETATLNPRINSFLCLMGSTKEKEKEVTIEILNGKEDSELWSAEELKDLTRQGMKNIILKNAFGPDFITYDKMQAQWLSSNLSYTPPNILGVFPLAAMINHSCVPNAVRTFSNGSIMVAHACQAIPAGQEIVWSYIPPTQVMADRRRALKKRHGFLCKCERCMIEAKELRKDLLPMNLRQALDEANKWNESMLDTSRIDETSKRQLCAAAIHLEETLFSSKSLSNEVKRHVRVGYTNLHFNYFNTMLAAAKEQKQHQKQNVQELVLQSATQLHFAYCSSNNTSTEHLSVLHLCYELATTATAGAAGNIKFWTEAMKRAHMTRYGPLGSNVSMIRSCMVHTRTILRQRDGYLQVKSNFL